MYISTPDIVIIGAGPAGSTAASAAAELGADVLIIEEHTVPGLPVFCGEAISVEPLKSVGFKPGHPITNEPIRKANFYTPNGKRLIISPERVVGYTINRDIFDGLLSAKALTSGTRLMLNTRATKVVKRNGKVVGVEAEYRGESFTINAKVVIGADGHSSMVRRSALGIPYFKDFAVCAQHTLAGLDIQEPDAVEIWLGRKYAPGGYAWMFPKSRTVANVGVGVRNNQATKPALHYLREFIDQRPELRDGEIIRRTGGVCPVTGPLDRIVGDGVMLVGDAAGHIIPMTGAGVETAISAGRIAGRVAVEAVQEGDTSKTRLGEYPRIFNQRWGRLMEDSKRLLNVFDALSDEDLNRIFDSFTPKQVQSLAFGENITRNLLLLAFKAPRLAFKILARL